MRYVYMKFIRYTRHPDRLVFNVDLTRSENQSAHKFHRKTERIFTQDIDDEFFCKDKFSIL